MRDPNRIDVVLDAIRDSWVKNPDLRLMQLLVNTINPDQRCPELYYTEDEALLNKFRITGDD